MKVFFFYQLMSYGIQLAISVKQPAKFHTVSDSVQRDVGFRIYRLSEECFPDEGLPQALCFHIQFRATSSQGEASGQTLFATIVDKG